MNFLCKFFQCECTKLPYVRPASSAVITFSEAANRLAKWAKDTCGKTIIAGGFSDMKCALYSSAAIRGMVNEEIPLIYNHSNVPGALAEYSDCDDVAEHHRYWLRRCLPGCPVFIVTGINANSSHRFPLVVATDGVVSINGTVSDWDKFTNVTTS